MTARRRYVGRLDWRPGEYRLTGDGAGVYRYRGPDGAVTIQVCRDVPGDVDYDPFAPGDVVHTRTFAPAGVLSGELARRMSRPIS